MKFFFKFFRRLSRVPLTLRFTRIALKAVLFNHSKYLWYCFSFAGLELLFFLIANISYLTCSRFLHFADVGLIFFLSEQNYLFLLAHFVFFYIVLLIQNYISICSIIYTIKNKERIVISYYIMRNLCSWTLIESIMMVVISKMPVNSLIFFMWALTTFFVLPLIVYVNQSILLIIVRSFIVMVQEIFDVVSVELVLEGVYFLIAILLQILFFEKIAFHSCTIGNVMLVFILLYLNAVVSIAQAVVSTLLLYESDYFEYDKSR